MRIMRFFLVCLAFLLLSQALVSAQDLSKYRNFSFGMTLAQLSKSIERSPRDATAVLQRPALIQEVLWWPPQGPVSAPPELVPKIVFSFYNGDLYRIAVSYDREATRGLTIEDMVRAISVKYGTSLPVAPPSSNSSPLDWEQAPVARWESSDFRYDLFHSGSWSDFLLVMVAKSMELKVQVASALALTLEKAEAPAKEAERQKKEVVELELARQKNKKIFRP